MAVNAHKLQYVKGTADSGTKLMLANTVLDRCLLITFKSNRNSY